MRAPGARGRRRAAAPLGATGRAFCAAFLGRPAFQNCVPGAARGEEVGPGRTPGLTRPALPRRACPRSAGVRDASPPGIPSPPNLVPGGFRSESISHYLLRPGPPNCRLISFKRTLGGEGASSTFSWALWVACPLLAACLLISQPPVEMCAATPDTVSHKSDWKSVATFGLTPPLSGRQCDKFPEFMISENPHFLPNNIFLGQITNTGLTEGAVERYMGV